MKYEILRNYLPEFVVPIYERSNPRFKVKTLDCLRATFPDGSNTTYVIFEGPYTKPYMCRDCGSHYELMIGTTLVMLKKV